MRWVLIRPLNQSLYYDPEIQEPLGIEYLAAVLEKKDCKVLVLDSALDDLNDIKLARRAISFEPDIIGFSITTEREIGSVLNIFNECNLQKENKEIGWIAGGNFVTTEPDNSDKLLPKAFRLVRFEAEEITESIVAKWKDKQTFQDIRFIDGGIPENLDEIPFPLRPYASYIIKYGWAFNLQASRGCCSACKYCASSGMRQKNKTWRSRSPENIVAELAFLNDKYGARTFNFVDEDFLGPPPKAFERVKSFHNEIIKNSLDITYGIQIRPNSLSEEIIDYLVVSGLKYVFMGIESDQPNDFKYWGRKYCPDVWRWVELLQKNDVEVNAGTLLFHPYSTLTGIRSFAQKLHKYNLFNYRTAINRMDAMPGSFFHNQIVAQSKSTDNYSGIIPIPFHNPEIETFYKKIIYILTPISAPSMHAICSLPPIQILRKSSLAMENKYLKLKHIIRLCDQRVKEDFFRLLDLWEEKLFSSEVIETMKKENIKFGNLMVHELMKNGFVRSPEMLNRAIIKKYEI